MRYTYLWLVEHADKVSFSARSHSYCLDDNASRFIKKSGHNEFFNDLHLLNCKWKVKVSWSDMEVWKNRRDRHQTLGSAMYIMGSKQCRVASDYYFALAGMIGFSSSQAESLADDPFQAFYSLAVHALSGGDYTPILCTPLRAEASDPRAPWLIGYSTMSELYWDLGVCHQKADATSLDIVRDGKICPLLQSVGVIESWDFLPITDRPAELIRFITARILQASGDDAAEFRRSIDKILTSLDRKAMYNSDIPKSEVNADNPDSSNPGVDYQLRPLLKALIANDAGGSGNEGPATGIAEKIYRLLRLDRPEKKSKDNRVDLTMSEAEWYVTKHDKQMEGIARIRCTHCKRRSVFRLTCWQPPTLEISRVFRIPGLLYDETVPNGVGLVLSGDSIIGKMISGTPSCSCLGMERISIPLRGSQ
jgi:hypothetical protein